MALLMKRGKSGGKFLAGIVFVILAGLAFAKIASAHQPRIVEGGKITQIQNPEISQAFYGELNGQSAFFEVELKEPTNVYFGVLVPDIPDKKEMSAEIVLVSEKNITRYLLEGKKSVWDPFYEEYAGDNYFQGPEYRAEFPAGKYSIKVFNAENKGKYVFAVGEKESFLTSEILKTLSVLPELKKNFFNKPVSSIFSGKIGKFFLIGVFILVLILIALFFAIRVVYNKFLKKKIETE